MSQELRPDATIALERSRLVDFVMLTKPELTLLSVLTTLGGFYFGSTGGLDGVRLLWTLAGAACVGGGAGALNQYIERRYDGVMRRTEHRPLPSGRIAPLDALVFGVSLSLVGILLLMLFVNMLTSMLAGVTWCSYLFLYTPLKRITPTATLVGAVPGAIPPVMGWTAATNSVSGEAWVLFAILFFWQVPHFLSLAWMYRKDYARAGYRLLPTNDTTGYRTASHVLAHMGLLIIASLLPFILGDAGVFYAIGALILGLAFLGTGLGMFRARTSSAARRLFSASLVYLPILFLLLLLGRF